MCKHANIDTKKTYAQAYVIEIFAHIIPRPVPPLFIHANTLLRIVQASLLNILLPFICVDHKVIILVMFSDIYGTCKHGHINAQTIAYIHEHTHGLVEGVGLLVEHLAMVRLK